MPPKLSRRAKPAVAVPSVIAPRLFNAIESLCRESLVYSGNQTGMRNAIVALIGTIRTLSNEQFGHDTPDIRALGALLERTHPSGPTRREAERDPIDELQRQAHLDGEQAGAADLIRTIWRGWSRYLTVAARSYEQKSSRAQSRALDPVSVMGKSLLNEWHYIYVPWYDSAKINLIERKDGSMVSAVRLVLHIVNIPAFPGQIDLSERLKKGTALGILKDELSSLANWIERGRNNVPNDDGVDIDR